ncbi:MAG: ammonium transporter [Rickettsiales bacterium]
MLKIFPRLAAVAMAALLFSVPALAADAAPKIDTGNTAWLLLSAALVMLMTPGLAFFYGGMVHHKNVVSTLLQNYVALAIVGIVWVVVGYSLVFTENTAYIGGTANLMLAGLENTLYGETGIPNLAYVAFQMMFAIITPALITGAFAERVNFKAWLIIMVLWSLVVYVPVAHWVWGPGGWIAAKGGLDFAGGLVVHITAGFSALACGFLFGRRGDRAMTVASDVPMVMLGAALLWFGWFGFNAGSAVTSGALASYAFMNTFLAAAVAFLVWMVLDWCVHGKPTAVGSSIGIVVGLVAITPAAGFVTLQASLIIGAVAPIVCFYTALAVKKITHLNDSLDVFACHGVGGVVGAVMTGLYASKAVNPAVAVEGYFVSGETGTFIANLEGVLAVAIFSFVATAVIVKVVDAFVPIRVGTDAEGHGLDSSQHGEAARSAPSMNSYSFK